MLTYPEIDPVIFQLGPFEIAGHSIPLQLRWYSLMYLIGIAAVWLYLRYSSKKGTLRASLQAVEEIMLWAILGMIIGARLVYVVIYNPIYYGQHLNEIFGIWQGGLSLHGGVVGVVIAIFIKCHISGISFPNVMDHIATIIPLGFGCGRIGNFINGELWGRITDSSLGMVFPGAGPLPRYPSQLFQSALEGWGLLIIMFILRAFKFKDGVLGSSFLVLYGIFRFILEFFREPDSQLGTVMGPLSMGQVLSAIMIVAGAILVLIFSQRSQQNV